MMKLSVVILFLFFTLSLARTPLTLSENDVTHLKENDVILPELPKTLLESDKSVLPTVTLPSKSDHEETRSVHPLPLTLVRFRPINRRFRLRSNLPFRLCHHMNQRSRLQIPIGDDMILSSKRNIDFDKFVYHIGVRQIPSDPFNFHHHHHHRYHYDNEKIWKFLADREKFGEMKLNDQSPHHHHHHDDEENNDHERAHRVDDDDDVADKISKLYTKHYYEMKKGGVDQGKFGEIESKDENQFRFHQHDDEVDQRSKLYTKHHEMKKGGFMRGIRKFLHNYFD